MLSRGQEIHFSTLKHKLFYSQSFSFLTWLFLINSHQYKNTLKFHIYTFAIIFNFLFNKTLNKNKHFKTTSKKEDYLHW